jgi:SAM-dependent methyltransferase
VQKGISGARAVSSWDPVWDEIFSNRKWGRYPPEHLIRFVAGNRYRVPNRNEVHLLEIGCGPVDPGPMFGSWLVRVSLSLGLMAPPTAIKQANERLLREGLTADLHVGDYSSLPRTDSTFEGVVENVSLYCNRRDAVKHGLAEVRRVLKLGAPFLSSFFTDRTWGYGQGRIVEKDGFVDMTEGPLSGAGFCLFLKRARIPELFQGFDDVAVERISRTVDGEKRLIEQFVITRRKPAA